MDKNMHDNEICRVAQRTYWVRGAQVNCLKTPIPDISLQKKHDLSAWKKVSLI